MRCGVLMFLVKITQKWWSNSGYSQSLDCYLIPKFQHGKLSMQIFFFPKETTATSFHWYWRNSKLLSQVWKSFLSFLLLKHEGCNTRNIKHIIQTPRQWWTSKGSKSTNWEHHLLASDQACTPSSWYHKSFAPSSRSTISREHSPFICCVHIQRAQQEGDLCFTFSGLQRNKIITRHSKEALKCDSWYRPLIF